MHKIDRSSITPPSCLAAYDFRLQSWDEFGGECKRAVRLALQCMQSQRLPGDDTNDEAEFILGLRCAYCEKQIFFGGHIEHFRRKNRNRPDGYPELTFVWDNLFLACGSHDHCGHYKDRPSAANYDPDYLIKPDIHDPHDFLYFHSSGSVLVRNTRIEMTNEDRLRASETIRVFNLDCPQLQSSRRRAIQVYRQSVSGILESLMTWEAELRDLYIQEEIMRTQWDSHSTVIRHFFEKAA